MDKNRLRKWVGRVLIGLVWLFNVQCALAFILAPGRYAAGFELSGAVGSGVIKGMGILFLMWNVPYTVALSDPVRQRVSLYEAAAMQAIGFAGETLLLLTFPGGHPLIQQTIGRFMLFDGVGLLAILLAAFITRDRFADRNAPSDNLPGL